MDSSEPDIEPVGQDYIEELKSEDGEFCLLFFRVWRIRNDDFG